MNQGATWPQCRDMTAEQMQAWGEAELAARKADLEDRTQVGLLTAQANAERRRKAIGASRGQAAVMVTDATRSIRRREAA